MYPSHATGWIVAALFVFTAGGDRGNFAAIALVLPGLEDHFGNVQRMEKIARNSGEQHQATRLLQKIIDHKK